MPIDAYSLCPGGTGKRIKFCCRDLLGEWEKIQKMLDGDQFFACLQHIEQLEPQHPNRACLLAVKTQLLRTLDQADQHRQAAEQFVQQHPDNPIALAEWAMLQGVEVGSREGLAVLQKALAVAAEGVPLRVYEALGVLAQLMLHDGQVIAARALLLMQTAIHRDDPRPLQMAMQINASPNVPLLVKDDPTLDGLPADSPWLAEYGKAMEPMERGLWLQSADALDAVAAKAGGVPAIWKNLASLRAWLGDSAASVAALKKYASLDIPLEDAVEARALAMLMDQSSLGDEIDVLHVEYEVGDLEPFLAGLPMSSRAVAVPVQSVADEEEGSPPPRAAYVLLDKPSAKRADQIEQVPRLIGQVVLYGKQTDRSARVELLGVAANRLELAKALLDEIAPGALGAEPKKEVIDQVSASRQLVRLDWRLPEDGSHEELERLVRQLHSDALLRQWPELPLGVLGGKSPRQAASLPEFRVPLLAAIMVLEAWTDQGAGLFDFNQLRAALGLPELCPIDPTGIDADHLPLVRLNRLEIEKLSDVAITSVFRRVLAFRVPHALQRYSQALIDRPTMAGKDEQIAAFRTLAQSEPDSDRALDYLHRGCAAAEAAGQSSAAWDLMELPLRIERGEFNDASRLLMHLQRDHAREPGVAEALNRLMMTLGAGQRGAPVAAQAAPEPSIVVPGADQAEPGKIWTPDGQGAAAGSGKKLWTPE